MYNLAIKTVLWSFANFVISFNLDEYFISNISQAGVLLFMMEKNKSKVRLFIFT